MSTELYRIEQLYTTGWMLISEHLSQQQANEKLNELFSEGISPDRIRLVREQ
jgi:uncharacterized protein YoaH (UPF0181 family)